MVKIIKNVAREKYVQVMDKFNRYQQGKDETLTPSVFRQKYLNTN